ncbi:MAG: pseudaminic acid cytidylyltransferase [Bacteroidota bacterium]|jgi:N-acylneuraminate cytidylyltransferase
MSKLCIITARGGSKRIPRKNIKDFLGKPIIAYSIEVATKSGLFDEVMVSTDDPEIADIATQYGATVPFFRSAENANDFATTADVLLEVIAAYTKLNQTFDFVCCIYPTAPLVTAKRLEEGFAKLNQEGIHAVLPVVAFDYPIQRSLKMDDAQQVLMNWPEHLNTRSQDLPKVYHDAGQWYWLKTNPFVQTGKILNDHTFGLLLEALEVQDIDNAIDWQLAELKYKLIQEIK